MTKLKLADLPDDKPVRLSIELPAAVHRDLAAYAEILARDTDVKTIEPAKLIAPMLARFMASDRGFAKVRRARTIEIAAMSTSHDERRVAGRSISDK